LTDPFNSLSQIVTGNSKFSLNTPKFSSNLTFISPLSETAVSHLSPQAFFIPLYGGLKYVHKFFNNLPFKRWSLSPLSLEYGLDLVTHFKQTNMAEVTIYI